jgi:hypothetical protein
VGWEATTEEGISTAAAGSWFVGFGLVVVCGNVLFADFSRKVSVLGFSIQILLLTYRALNLS